MDPVEELRVPEARWADVRGPVHYREWPGPEEGPVFVCVHGLGGSLLNWAGVAPGLSRHGRVIALDLAGFGLTPPAGRSTHLSGSWRLLHGFLSALDLPPVVLVGNSMGGMLALIQAAHDPRTTARLVLVDAAFPRTNRPSLQVSPVIAGAFALYATSRAGEWVLSNRARRLGAEGLVRETLRLCAADPSSIDPALVEALVELTRTRQGFDYATRAFADAARSIFRAQVSPGRYRALVRSVGTPALVLHGTRDRLVPIELARAAAADHPNWSLVEFPDLGHIPQMEAPARCLEAVEGWLATMSPEDLRAVS
jgi:pimeloyl-ACP methyl ester carboxylesterase